MHPLGFQLAPEGGERAMPTGWTEKVKDAITNLEIKTDGVLEPDKALAIIDNVVEGKIAAARTLLRSAASHRSG